MPINVFFEYLSDTVEKERYGSIVRFEEEVTQQDRFNMAEGIYPRLTDYWNDREMVVDFAKPYLLVPYEGDDFKKLSFALVDTLLLRLKNSSSRMRWWIISSLERSRNMACPAGSDVSSASAR